MNQYNSRKSDLLDMLHTARDYLESGLIENARFYLRLYRTAYSLVPASTKRRWRCGR